MTIENSAESAYGKRRAQSWARIDMLLALYHSGISSISLAIDAAKGSDEVAANQHRLKAMSVIHGIMAGLDMKDSEITQSIGRLCEFISHALQDGSIHNLEVAKKVLSTLRDGFAAIREEAIELEENGTIAGVDLESAFNLTV